jgi:hypothetical protein
MHYDLFKELLYNENLFEIYSLINLMAIDLEIVALPFLGHC